MSVTGIRKRRRVEDAAEDNKGTTIGFAMDENFGNSTLRLLEATPELLAAIETAESVRIVAPGRDANAVLVTSDATYELCKVETSNAMLLVPPVDGSGGEISAEKTAVVVGSCGYHYELKKTRPRRDELRRILTESGSRKRSADGAKAARVWTLNELVQRVQGSEQEVLALLADVNAIKVPGGWRGVDDTLLAAVLDRLLSELTIHGIDFHQVEEEQCMGLLTDSSEEESMLVRHCLRVYGAPVDDPRTDGVKYKLDLDKVARFKARQVFREGHKKHQESWPRHAFMLEWEAALPDACKASPHLLKGLAIEEVLGAEVCLWYLCADSLPVDPKERLKRLFDIMPKWQLEQLEPYLRPVVPSAITLDEYLLKNTRTAPSPEGQRLYSAK